jgi:hypothetical protein
MKNGEGKICQFNLSDGKNLPHAEEHAKIHMDRMNKIENLNARVLTIEGDYNFPAAYCSYRWLDKVNKVLIPYYVYGDFLAMPLYKSDQNIEIISIHSKLLTPRYIEQFELFWDMGKIPDKGGDK